MGIAKWYKATSCNYLLNLTMQRVATISEVKTFWQAKAMLLFFNRENG